MENRIVLGGIVSRIEPCRFSPAGVPIIRFMLDHRSARREADLPREVRCRLPVMACGARLHAATRPLAVGHAVQVSGFLARASHRHADGALVLHAEHIEIPSV